MGDGKGSIEGGSTEDKSESSIEGAPLATDPESRAGDEGGETELWLLGLETESEDGEVVEDEVVFGDESGIVSDFR